MTDDRALVAGILRGEESAYRMLIRQHERLVAHMVGRVVKQQEDHEELCQDVFMKVFEKIGEFSFGSRLSTWIGSIAYHQAINHLRKRKLPTEEWPEDQEKWTDRFVDEQNPDSILSENDMDQWIFKLIDELPATYRQILLMFHKDQMTYEEIAAITGMPDGTVKNYLFRARQQLKSKASLLLQQ